MRKERKGNLLFRIVIISILLLQVNLFDLIPENSFWESINSNTNKYLVLIIISSALIIKLILNGILNSPRSTIDNSVFFFLLATLVIVVGSMWAYDQSFYTSFANGYYYLIFPLSYFLLKDYFKYQKNIIFFIDAVILIGIIYSVLYILKSKYGISIIHPVAVVDLNNMLSGNSELGFLRYQVPADYIFFSSFIYNLAVINKIKKMNFSYFLIQGILIFNLFFVGQVRTYFSISLIFILFTIFMKLIKKSGILAPILLILSALSGISVVYYLIKKLGFFEGNRISSMLVRTEAIPYYLSQAFNNKVFGIGFPDTGTHYLLIHGFSRIFNSSVFYIEDTGIFGIIGVFGIMGIVFILWLLKGIVRDIVENEHKFQQVGIVILYLSLFVTLIPLNSPRVILMALYLLSIKEFKKYYAMEE
ncbi:hypothetical protein [Pediococcus acidilactici]|uniref:hypothetical protein n=1 Tax=Pediococcus acidilactici TaxID=1254 RepID=UPI0018696E8C|nr:hypothetical protein [Pediococcus acidilactici]MDB8859136.1 hypothetical protein [Pediococcus acidilactici]MDB8860552.1 hypothetical protein [Pediococcus acidilactici]MDB8862838.1 hypothetical protein [Pediococcus acidilactici]MDB8866436.1 hypothetical protein [Pediococcus acidilactici]QOP74074.1 hypothetical protein ID874_02685 [Pediococcus acidilactici]